MNAYRLAAAALVLAAAAGPALAEPAPAAAAEPKKIQVRKLQPLVLGLTGYSGAEHARADSEALQKALTARLNRELTTRVFPNGEALANALAAGAIDLAWMQPFSVNTAQGKGPVTPVVKAVRHGLPFYRGVLFAKADAKLDEKSLAGKTVGWVNETSAAGYLFPRARLVRAGIKPAATFKAEKFLGDHEAVCRAVLEGKVDVGATFADDRPAGEPMRVDGCVQSLGAEASAGLRIVTTSEPIPNDAIVARPGLEADEIARIRRAFTGLKDDTDGKVLLLSVFKADAFDEVGESDFEPVKFAAEAVGK